MISRRLPPLRWAAKKAVAVAVFASFYSAAYSAEKVDEALARAGRHLVSQQDEKLGFINDKGGNRNETAMSSLAILAFAALGHQPGDATPEGGAMRKALAYVLRPESQEKDGYFGKLDGSRMYGHGITTLMLAEMIGMGADAEQDALLRDKTRKAIDLILRVQMVPKNDQNRGGWRYTPDAGDSDMSVTVWQTMALRAAKNAGMEVPSEAITSAVAYIKKCYEPEGQRGGANPVGGFGYQGRGREISTTAEGLLALQVCGEYESEEVKGAANRLLKEGVKKGERWFFYTTYYYAQGMYQRGDSFATTGEKAVADSLLPMQSPEGWWEAGGGEERQGGKVYATALSILSLAVKNHFLPIYQR